MTDHPESDHGVLVDLPGARCEEIVGSFVNDGVRYGWPRCGGQLQVYSRARPGRRAVVCSRCGAESYEVFAEDVA